MKWFLSIGVPAVAGLSACDSGETLAEIDRNQVAVPRVLPPHQPPNSAPYSGPEEEPGPEETAYLRRPRPAKGIRVAPDQIVEWDFRKHSAPARYRMGPMRVDVRAVPREEEYFALEVFVAAPGKRGRKVIETDPYLELPVSLSHGRLDRAGTPYLLIQTPWGPLLGWTGLRAVVDYPNGIKQVDLGHRHHGHISRTPADEDGDGLVDFVLRDDSFLYAFAPGTNPAPPQILNIVEGRAVDVSDRPKFRHFFTAFAKEARALCLRPEEGRSPNGACAAYVAASARAGSFEQAWAEMLGAFDRNSDWGLEKGCRVPVGKREFCPEEKVIKHPDYPAALRAYLRETGYLRG